MAKKSVTVTFLGDADPNVQSVSMYGRTYVKGESVSLSEDDPGFDKIVNNPSFSTEKNAEPVASEEPEAPDVEAGTELAALKQELRDRGQDVKGNPSVETLRKRLADAVAKDA